MPVRESAGDRVAGGGVRERVKGEGGQWVTLHSRHDPAGEAARAVESLKGGEGAVPVLLGGGLGYWASALRARTPESVPVVVVERDPDLWAEASGRLADLEGIEAVVGRDPVSVLDTVDRIRIASGLASVAVVRHPPSVSAWPSYYGPIDEALSKRATSPVKKAFDYPKFAAEKVRVIVLSTGYFLEREVSRAFEEAGHEAVNLSAGKGAPDVLKALLSLGAGFKPDFILSFNHLGFDEGGILAGVLDSLRVSVAVWYVDSPALVLRGRNENAKGNAAVFLWDMSHAPAMRELGFDRIEFLPLAADLATAVGGKWRERRPPPAAFVGNSMTLPVADWESRIAWTEEMRALAERVRGRLVGGRPRALAEKLLREEGLGEGELFFDIAGAVTWRATLEYRAGIARVVGGCGGAVFGDPGWKKVLGSVDLRPPVHYERELPALYRAVPVNVNATSLQMPRAVNQRAFDVPAAGGFLLTDDQPDLHDLFAVGREAAAFSSPEDLREKIAWFQARPEERERIVQAGHERVRRDHTYGHRVRTLIESMRRFAREEMG